MMHKTWGRGAVQLRIQADDTYTRESSLRLVLGRPIFCLSSPLSMTRL